jgi:uncharacterized protein YuzE
VGDLYVRFRHADSTVGEATKDGKVIAHYDRKGKIVAIEITDLDAVMGFAPPKG